MIFVLGGIDMIDSILNTIKELILGHSEDTDFDTDLIININTALSYLCQLGVGPEDGFEITGPDETWSELLVNEKALKMAITYVYLRVKIVFDPPSGGVLNSYESQIEELAWRLQVFGSAEQT